MSAHRALHDMYRAPFRQKDPGDTKTIYIDRWGSVVALVSSASAETRTLAVPSKAGLMATLLLDTDGGGDITITVTSGYNSDADTSIVLGDAGDCVTFLSIKYGTTYRWRLISQHGTDITLGGGDITFDELRMSVNAVNAAGGNIATATALTTGVNIVGAADNTKGVQLPTGAAGTVCFVKSTVASKTLPVYPPTGGQVNGGGANNAATLDSVAAGASAVFVASAASTWYTISGDLA